jgi:uncharacterized protein (DUF1697 family)
MEHLRALFEELGFGRVGTFIASGNVLFESDTSDDLKLAQTIELQLEKSLGYEVDTFVRTRDEIAVVATGRPFSEADLTNTANTVHVGFLKEPLSNENSRKLLACRTAVDEFRVNGREFYWLCRVKSHESKVWSSPQMKIAALPSATMRNLTTIRKLVALVPVL